MILRSVLCLLPPRPWCERLCHRRLLPLPWLPPLSRRAPRVPLVHVLRLRLLHRLPLHLASPAGPAHPPGRAPPSLLLMTCSFGFRHHLGTHPLLLLLLLPHSQWLLLPLLPPRSSGSTHGALRRLRLQQLMSLASILERPPRRRQRPRLQPRRPRPWSACHCFRRRCRLSPRLALLRVLLPQLPPSRVMLRRCGAMPMPCSIWTPSGQRRPRRRRRSLEALLLPQQSRSNDHSNGAAAVGCEWRVSRMVGLHLFHR